MTNPDCSTGPLFYTAADYVRAEISYLDSPTDYRECLPEQYPNGRFRLEPLVLLDDAAERVLWHTLATLTRSAVLLGLVISMVRG